MALRIRRGTDAQRSGVTLEMGEIVWTTDGQQLFVGNGVTQGGTAVIGAQILGYGLAYDALNKRIEVAGLTSDDVTPGINNKYFSTELAVDAVGAALVAGNLTNVGITFTYSQTQDDAGRINATVALDGVGIAAVVDDETPQLGGDLSLNSFNIEGTGNIDITGSITGTSLSTGGTITASTGLGANLSLNEYNITGAGDIETTGALRVNLTNNVQLRQELNGVSANGYITSTVHRGTFASPQAVQAGDELGGLLIKGYTNSNTSANAGLISFIVDDTAVIAGGDFIKSFVAIVASTDTTQDSNNALLIDSAGVTTSNAFVASKYTQLAVYANDAARSAAITAPAAGMMVFMTSGTSPAVSNKPVIFNGTGWEVF